MLTVISGKYRGKRLKTKASASIRPTGSRTRGAVFNILMHGKFGTHESSPLIDKSVIDLFCGTGALGIEALSRGAAHVTFVDQSSESIALARDNVAHIQAENSAHFIRTDSTSLPVARTTCHLAFLDPPYNSGVAGKSLTSLHTQGWLEDGAIAVVELSKKEQLTSPPHYTIFDEREYGNTKIVFLEYQKVTQQ